MRLDVPYEKQNYEHVSGGKCHQFCISIVKMMISRTTRERICLSIGHGNKPKCSPCIWVIL